MFVRRPLPRRAVRAFLLALPLTTAALAAPPVIGPGSAAWKTDQAALAEAVRAGAPDVGARVKAFFETHRVLEALNRLRRAAGLMLRGMPSRSGPTGPDSPGHRFAVSSIQHTCYDLVKYTAELAKYLPRVDAGEKSMEWAQKRAARWFRALSLVRHDVGMEISDMPAREAVFVVFPAWGRWDEDPHVQIRTLRRWKPDSYRLFKDSWQGLETRIALDRDFEVVTLDRDTPEEGYASLLRLLGYLDEIAPPVEQPSS